MLLEGTSEILSKEPTTFFSQLPHLYFLHSRFRCTSALVDVIKSLLYIALQLRIVRYIKLHAYSRLGGDDLDVSVTHHMCNTYARRS